MENTKSSLSLINRNTLSITGIKKIRSTEPSKIIANLENCSIVIQGSNMTVETVNISSGTLDIKGQINGVSYTGAQRKFSFKNVFK